MDAKSNPLRLRRTQTSRFKIVDDSQMASDGNVGAAYDAQERVNNESHSISTTVTADFMMRLWPPLKAKAADQKATDVKNADERYCLLPVCKGGSSSIAAPRLTADRSRALPTGGGSSLVDHPPPTADEAPVQPTQTGLR